MDCLWQPSSLAIAPTNGQLPDPLSINPSSAPLIDAVGFGLLDARTLTLPANIVLKFRDRAQNRERELARATAGVDALVDALKVQCPCG